MRIVFLSPSGALGGAETALVEIVAALRQARPAWALTVIASAEGPLLERARSAGADVAALPFPAALSRLGEWGRRGTIASRARLGAELGGAVIPALRYAAHLRHDLDALSPDIIHSNGMKMHLLGAQAGPRTAALVWHLHDYPDARPMTAALLKRQVRHSAQVIANSDSVAAHARTLFGAGVPVQTVYNAVDLDRFTPEGPRADLERLAGEPARDGVVRVGLVATFARWKGHDVFLRAMASVLRDHSHVRGYIVGGPIYETDASQFSLAELKAEAAALGIANRITFAGRTDDVASAMRALDIVVHASTEAEPFGLVIAEAMACGRPVVVSRAGGAEEIARAGALFHAPADSGELAARIGELVASPARRVELGSQGRAAAEQWFSKTRLAESLVPLYERIAPHRH